MTLEYLLRQIYVIYSIIISKENSLELYPRQSKIFDNQTYKDIKEWEHWEYPIRNKTPVRTVSNTLDSINIS